MGVPAAGAPAPAAAAGAPWLGVGPGLTCPSWPLSAIRHRYDEDDGGKHDCAAYHHAQVAIQDVHLLG